MDFPTHAEAANQITRLFGADTPAEITVQGIYLEQVADALHLSASDETTQLPTEQESERPD